MQSYIDLGTFLSLLMGVVLPYIVGYVTGSTWSGTVKGLLLAVLSIITSVVAQWIDALNSHTSFDWRHVVVGAVLTYVWAHTTHASVTSHTRLSKRMNAAPPLKIAA